MRIQLFGDTQAGYDGSTGSELAGSKSIAPHNPTSMLQGYFDATYGAGKVVVQSMALEGTTTRDLVAGVDKHDATVTAPWPSSVDADRHADSLMDGRLRHVRVYRTSWLFAIGGRRCT